MELQQLDAVRHKMTENIVYLQNEIRKRDELLENSSEFGDFEMIDGEEDDDSSIIVGAEGDEYSNRGGGEAQSMRGTGEDSQREPDAVGGSSVRHSFMLVKKVTTKRRTANHALQNQLEETRQ